MKFIYAIIVGVFLMTSCNSTPEPVSTTMNGQAVSKAAHQVVAKEVIQTSAYTYMLVSENNEDFWIAVSRMDAHVGEEYYYADALEMREFKSKELSRIFDRIFFVQDISGNPVAQHNHVHNQPQAQTMKSKSKSIPTDLDESIVIEPVEGGITIGDLYKNGEQYADKKVIVKGKVMKVNKNIMNRNWIHLQDGTSHDGKYDLTLTSDVLVELGTIVTLEGKVSLNKAFGGGYSYELVIEEATIK